VYCRAWHKFFYQRKKTTVMSQEAQENNPVNELEGQENATRKLEERIDDMNNENRKNAAVRKQSEQDAQNEGMGKTPQSE
jgi:hypothetical protein